MPAPERYLLRDLKALGIDHPDLLEQMLRLVNLDLPYFTLIWPTEFPDGRLDMELHCRQDINTGDWELQDYKIIFNKAIILPAEYLQGIDVLSLDKAMANMDWRKVLSESPIRRPYLIELLGQVNALKDMGSEGQRIYDLLCIKHWSGTILYDPRLDELKRTYVAEQHVTIKEPIEENIRYWYHLLSGRFDQYHAELEKIGFPSPLQLKRKLVYSEGDFNLTKYKVMPDGIMQVNIPLVDKSGTYQVDRYQLKLHSMPAIIDGIYNGVDTALLQVEMKRIDWMDDESHYKQVDGGENSFTEEVTDIMWQLQQILPVDYPGHVVSSQLQLKYWSESPDFIGIIDDDSWSYFSSLPFKQIELPVNISAIEGYQLISGNILFHKDQSEMLGEWLHAVPDPDRPEILLLRTREGISSGQLNQLLLQLPCGRNEIDAATKEIKDGKMGTAVLNTGQSVRISVDPFRGQLKLFSMNGLPLHLQVTHRSMQLQTNPGQIESFSPGQMKQFLRMIHSIKKKKNGL